MKFFLWNYWAVVGIAGMVLVGVVCAAFGATAIAVFGGAVILYQVSISSSKAHTTSKGYDGTKGEVNTYLEDFMAYFGGMPVGAVLS